MPEAYVAAGVSSLNSEKEAINIVAGANINVTPSGQNITIAANAVSAIFGSYSTTGNLGAVTNAINYAPPATAGTYRLSFSVDLRVATLGNFHIVATWTDASGVSRSQTLGGSDSVGSALVAGAMTNAIGAGTYYGSALIQIDASGTAITLSTVGTFTTVTYDLAATLEQLA